MKKLILLSALILASIYSFAQSSKPKMIEMLKQMQNAKGKITLAIEGKTYTEKASFFQNPKGMFVISTDLASAQNTYVLVIPNKVSGKYPFSTAKNEETLFVLTGGNYETRSGTITLNNNGGKISGTFMGQAQKMIGKKGKLKPEGNPIPFSGSFSGLTI